MNSSDVTTQTIAGLPLEIVYGFGFMVIACSTIFLVFNFCVSDWPRKIVSFVINFSSFWSRKVISFASNFNFRNWLRSLFAPTNQGCPCQRDPPERSCRGGKD